MSAEIESMRSTTMNMVALEFRDSATTHAGFVRSSNQDAYCCKAAAGIWAVADGMGGHHGGERASAVIVQAIENIPEYSSFAQRLSAARAGIAEANRIIFDEADLSGRRMGATIVVLVVGEGHYAILWAGDSRAYLKRGDTFQSLTRDHTQAEELVTAGLLQPDAVVGHPSSHVLVRAVGVLPSVDLDQVGGQIVDNDIFLLCSDGLYNLVSDAEMVKIIETSEFSHVSEHLVELSLERGAPDNVTVCLAFMGGRNSASGISFESFHQ
jgi:serine/threonine protein phosphatase Stp1